MLKGEILNYLFDIVETVYEQVVVFFNQGFDDVKIFHLIYQNGEFTFDWYQGSCSYKYTTVVQLYNDTTVTFDFKIQHNSTTLVFTTFTTPQLCEFLM